MPKDEDEDEEDDDDDDDDDAGETAAAPFARRAGEGTNASDSSRVVAAAMRKREIGADFQSMVDYSIEASYCVTYEYSRL
mmetsp:Transcript_53713/g.160826  ORF Transcript_53713/g.160826 Transcript_53713/m.160826 type:complete len:80 (+) Transcript_53713:1705-1944(+)